MGWVRGHFRRVLLDQLLVAPTLYEAENRFAAAGEKILSGRHCDSLPFRLFGDFNATWRGRKPIESL